VILLALLVPALMMVFLFAAAALEDLIFPRPTNDDVDPQAGHQVPKTAPRSGPG
jgi:hypothetical protein